MAAVWMRVRAELRARWRTWLGLALVAGLAGGATIAAASGARRTSTAFPRFLEWSQATDLSSTQPKEGFREEDYVSYLAAIAQLPQVVDSIRGYTPSQELITSDGGRTGPFELRTGVDPTNRAGTAIDRIKILAGRRPNPARADEASLSFSVQGPGLRLGDVVKVVLRPPDYSPGEHLASVRIVGIHASAGDFPSVSSASFPGLHLTPAFFTANRSFIADDSNQLGISVRLRHGARDAPAFLAEAARAGIPLEFTSTAGFAAGVQKAIRFEAVALWLFAALVGVAGLALLAQALARETALEAGDHLTVRALGSSSRQLFAAGMARAVIIGTAGTVVAIAVAISASPLTPIGLARTAEPQPGVWTDALVLGLGGLATLVGVILAAVPSALRAANPARTAFAARRRPVSTVVELLARSGAPAPAVTGVRMALEPARGIAEANGRVWMIGAAGGVAAFAAALVFAASLHHLLATPRLGGYVWDVWAGGGPDLEPALQADEHVVDFSHAAAIDAVIDGRPVFTVALDTGGSIRPLIVDGRAPETPDEIALGSATMRELGVSIGSTIRITGAASGGGMGGSDPKLMRVVGRAVIPSLIFKAHEPGDGAFVTYAGGERLDPTGVPEQGVFVVRVKPGTDLDHGLEIPAFVLPRRKAGELTTLSGISGVPLALAGVLAAIGFATLIQILVTTVRRQRRDLAVLRSLGFVRRQLHGTIVWQTTTMMTVALVVGIPAGVVLGRWGWVAFADQLAVFPVPRVPLTAVLLVIPATLAIANLIATLPARAASRTRPALVLRTE